MGSAVETEAQTLNARKDNNYDYMYPFLEPKGIFHELYPLLVSTTLTHYVLRLSLITFWLPSGLTLALLSLLFYWLRLLFRWFTFVCVCVCVRFTLLWCAWLLLFLPEQHHPKKGRGGDPPAVNATVGRYPTVRG